MIYSSYVTFPCLVALYLMLAYHPVQADTLGLHGLAGGATPPSDPVLPEITGPFRLVLQASFHRLPSNLANLDFRSIFHWFDESTGDFIFLGHRNRPGGESFGSRTELQIRQGGDTTKCRTYANLAEDVVYTFTATVPANGHAVLSIDGVISVNCIDDEVMNVPENVVRKHYLGESPSSFDKFVDLDGGISGIQITHLGVAQHPRDTFKFRNFPGQPFQQGFVVSFYARFDDLSANSWQTMFDFGSSASNDNIRCGQLNQDAVMRCSVYDSTGIGSHVDSNPITGALVEGEFAFWHFGVDATGQYWLLKNEVQVGSSTGILPNNVFRSAQSFIHDLSNTGHMDGVVLGLRLDSVQVS